MNFVQNDSLNGTVKRLNTISTDSALMGKVLCSEEGIGGCYLPVIGQNKSSVFRVILKVFVCWC